MTIPAPPPATPTDAVERQLRIGLIGPGANALEQLIPCIQLCGRAKLVGVASRTTEGAKGTAQRFGADVFTNRWKDLCDPALVDGLVVSVGPAVHALVLAEAIKVGIPVFVEKPPTRTPAQLRALADLEAKRNAVVFVDYNFVYGETFGFWAEALARHGVVRHLKLRFVSSKPRSKSNTYSSLVEQLLYEMAIHPFSIAANLFGEARSVSASCCSLGHGMFAIHITAMFSDGRLVTIDSGNYSNRLEYRCEGVTDQGATVVLDQHNEIQLWQAGAAPRLDTKEMTVYTWPSRRGGYARTGYQVAFESFIDSALGISRSRSSLARSLPIYDMLERAQQSIESTSDAGGH